MEIERSEEEHQLPARKWINQLVMPGSSWGARPKASVMGEDKMLYVAKFPSRKDDYDAGLWEHFSHLLAKKAGIHAAHTEVLSIGEKYHTLLSRRFDRTPEAAVFISLPQWPYQGFLMGIMPRQGMSNKADSHILLDACEEYMIGRKAAEDIIREIAGAAKDWRSLAVRLGISPKEMNVFAGVLEERCK